MKNKTTTALLALFLGGIGVHRFYLGQTGLGIIYLLFCWTFIPAFIAFVDFIIFLTMNENSFNSKYNVTKALYNNLNFSSADELGKLYALKEKGVITQQEFDRRKSQLL